MATIYRYEVEAAVKNKETGKTDIVKMLQPAYSVMDAYMQFVIAVQGEHGQNIDITHQRVGPPQEDVRAQLLELTNAIAETMRSVAMSKEGRLATDAVGVSLDSTHGKATVARKI